MSEDPVHRREFPLDELRQAWGRAEPPRRDPRLEACDERTRAAVAWMQAAWSRIEAPEPRVPLILGRRRWQLWAHALAAAAGVLLALGTYFALQRAGDGVRPGDVDTPIAATSSPTEEPLPAGRSSTGIDDGIELAALASDRLELRSGPVRLILLTGEDSPRTEEN